MLTRNQALAQLTAPGAPFELAEVVEAGIPLRVFAHAPRSLRAVLEASAAFGERDFLIYEGERISYAGHLARAARLAHWLRLNGVASGDRVGICMRNYPEWSIAFWACQSIGAIAVTLNAWWIGSELVYGIQDSDCRAVVLDGERIERLEGHWQELPQPLLVVVARADAAPGQVALTDILADEQLPDTLPDVDVGPTDPSSIMYTSGTTGFPKGALHTHRNHITNIQNTLLSGAAAALVAADASPADAAGAAVEPPVPCSLQTFPLFHIGGLSGLYISLVTGARLVLMYRWDAGRALELIEREGVRSVSAVPTVVRQLLELAAEQGRSLDSLAGMASGGAVVPPDLIDRIGGQFSRRVAPANGYGATETTSAVISNGGADYFSHPDSVGQPAATADVRIVDDNGSNCAAGDVGELWIRGPNVVAGYWNRPEATEEAFGGGWYRTGDLGYVDADGFHYVVDRKKDVVIRGGENVYCAEVEAVLHEHPDIVDVAVIGLPHRMLGEEVGAVIEARPGATVSVESVREFAQDRMAPFKIPSRVFLVDEPMPRTASGKVIKRQLKERFAG